MLSTYVVTLVCIVLLSFCLVAEVLYIFTLISAATVCFLVVLLGFLHSQRALLALRG